MISFWHVKYLRYLKDTSFKITVNFSDSLGVYRVSSTCPCAEISPARVHREVAHR